MPQKYYVILTTTTNHLKVNQLSELLIRQKLAA